MRPSREIPLCEKEMNLVKMRQWIFQEFMGELQFCLFFIVTPFDFR